MINVAKLPDTIRIFITDEFSVYVIPSKHGDMKSREFLMVYKAFEHFVHMFYTNAAECDDDTAVQIAAENAPEFIKMITEEILNESAIANCETCDATNCECRGNPKCEIGIENRSSAVSHDMGNAMKS